MGTAESADTYVFITFVVVKFFSLWFFLLRFIDYENVNNTESLLFMFKCRLASCYKRIESEDQDKKLYLVWSIMESFHT